MSSPDPVSTLKMSAVDEEVETHLDPHGASTWPPPEKLCPLTPGEELFISRDFPHLTGDLPTFSRTQDPAGCCKLAEVDSHDLPIQQCPSSRRTKTLSWLSRRLVVRFRLVPRISLTQQRSRDVDPCLDIVLVVSTNLLMRAISHLDPLFPASTSKPILIWLAFDPFHAEDQFTSRR